MAKKLLDFFPKEDSPRKQQIEILEQIDKAKAEGQKYIIIQAPTGAGKSHIAATLSAASRAPNDAYVRMAYEHRLHQKAPMGGYENEARLDGMKPFGCGVLTVSKALQDQYSELFTGADPLKGRANYVCDVDEDFDCDLAPCMITPKILTECKAADRCPFLNARRDSMISKFSVLNYSAFLSLPPHLQKRQYLVCDEASELEDEFVKRYSCDLNYKKLHLEDLGISKLITEDRAYIHRWLTDAVEKIKGKQESLQDVFKRNKNNKRVLISTLNKMRQFRSIFEKLTIILNSWYATEYIVEFTAADVKFTPLNVNILAQNFFKRSDTVILMSGTIIDHKTFAKSLGITDYAFIEVDSDFEADHSPIYCMDKFKLNYRNLDFHLPEMVKMTEMICDKYPDDKGIVHTHTFKITEALKQQIKGKPRYLTREAGVTNEFLISTHKMSDAGTVLISPSLAFGTDLADDFGRFSIILKTPFLPLNDKRIKTLSTRDPKWYQMKTMVNLVQMCGRTTRNKDDYSDTFILDGTATDLIKRNSSLLPKYFVERIQ